MLLVSIRIFSMCKFWLSQPLYAHFGPQFLLYVVPHAPHPLQMVLGQQHQIGLPSLVSPQPHRFILLQKLSCPWIPTNTNESQKTVDRFKLRQTNITKRPAQPEPGYSHGGRISTAAPQCVNKSQIRAWAARVSPPMRWSVCLWFRLIQYVIQNMFSMLPLNMLMANLCSDV